MRHDIEALRHSRITDKATLRKRLLGSASPIAAAAHKPAPGFRVRKSTWLLIRAFAKQPRRALGHLALRLFYKSKRRIKRMREALQRATSRFSRPSAGASLITRGSAPSNLGLLALEPRIVFDAAAGATADQTADQVAQQQAESVVDAPPQTEAYDATSDADALDLVAVAAAGEQRQEIAFVDGSVRDVDQIIAGLDPAIEVVMLDSTRDGVEQIAAALQGRSGIDAIHIVSHGSQGHLNLGTGLLTAASMQGEHLDELTTIGQALSADGDILIYGCDFTGGERGLEAAMLLGGITGADIAASTDATGHTDLGGDWDLETEIGAVETNAVEATDWHNLLVQTTINPTGGVNTTGSDGLRIFVTNDGQLQVRYQNTDQLYNTGVTDSSPGLFNGVYMAVGTQMVGPDTGAENLTKVAWTPQSQALTGTGTTADPFVVTTRMFYNANTGNGAVYDPAADVMMEVRTSYVLPNKYFTQTVTITPPATNASTIKFYHSIDTFLAGGDNGPAYSLDPSLALTNNTTGDPNFVGVRKGVGTPTESIVGLAEVQGGRQFDRYFSAQYDLVYPSMANGGDITNTWNTNPATDNGIAIQYTLGAITTPTTFSYHIAFDGDTRLDLDANNSTTTGNNYTGNFVPSTGEEVSVVDSDVLITNVIGDIADATVTLTNAQAGDVLSINTALLPPGITLEARSANSITISGVATEADYQTALRLIKFSTSDGSAGARMFTVELHNQLNSITTSATATLSAGFSPTIDLNSGLQAVPSTNNIVVNGGFSDFADTPSAGPSRVRESPRIPPSPAATDSPPPRPTH
jgi:hypothetical protein